MDEKLHRHQNNLKFHWWLSHGDDELKVLFQTLQIPVRLNVDKIHKNKSGV